MDGNIRMYGRRKRALKGLSAEMIQEAERFLADSVDLRLAYDMLERVGAYLSDIENQLMCGRLTDAGRARLSDLMIGAARLLSVEDLRYITGENGGNDS